MSPVGMPHDRAIKLALSDVRVARDLFAHYLPINIQALLDLEQLSLQSGSFVDKDLKASCTDLLYKAPLFDDEVSSGYVYLLLEAQRRPDKWMAFRLWKYMARILDQHLRQYPKSTELPLVVPLVLYIGDGVYPYSLELKKLFGARAEEAENLLLGPYSHVDLHTIPDERLCEHTWSGLLELVLKQAQKRDALQLLEILVQYFFDPLKHQPHADMYIEGMLSYLLDQADIVDVDQFFELLKGHVLPETEEKMMTIAERLIQRGMQQGMQQGMQEGIQQGMQRGMQEGMQQGMQRGMQEGMQQGIQQGVEQAQLNIAREMLLKGYEEKAILELSHLSLEKVRHLKEESSINVNENCNS